MVQKQPGAVATAGGVAHRAAGRGRGDGIHCPILETAVERPRTVLETELSKSGRCRENVGNTPSGASIVQPRTTRAQERLSGRGTFGEAVGFPGADFELCARYPTATVEDTHTHKVSTDAGQSPSAESTGGPAGRSAYQIIQSGLGSVGGQCASYAACASGGRNRSGGASRLGPSALACYVGRVARRAGRLHRTQPGLPSARKIGTGRLAINRAADRPTGPGDRESAQRASGCGQTASRNRQHRKRVCTNAQWRGGAQM